MCPVGSVFLGQALIDCDGAIAAETDVAAAMMTPVILLFDILSIGHKNIAHLPAKERYRILREECESHFDVSKQDDDNNDNNNCSMALPPLLVNNARPIRVQWAGDFTAALNFCRTNAHQLPHRVECLIGLSDEHPLILKRLELFY